jgi:hypothetical protein
MKDHRNTVKFCKAVLTAALAVCMLFALPACTISRGVLSGGPEDSSGPSPSVSSFEEPSASPSPSPTPEPKRVLTITEIGMDLNSGLSGVKATDETGQEVELSGNPAEWFEGGSTFEITLPEGSTMLITPDGSFALDEASSLEISVVIDGANQAFTLKAGSTFDYMLDDSGDIKLLLGDNVTTAPTNKPRSAHMLTVTFVALEDMTVVGEVTCNNENGEEVVLSANWNEWFDNASIDNLELLDTFGNPGSVHMEMANNNPYSLGDGSHFKVTATIDGTAYTFDVGVGSTFQYTTAGDGSIKLVVDDAFTPVS